MKTMTIEQFIQLLEIYGSDLNRMPAEKAAAASLLLEKSPEAKAELARAQMLDQSLENHMAAIAGMNNIDLSALEARITAAAFKGQEIEAELAEIIDHPAKRQAHKSDAIAETQPAANDNWRSNIAATGLLAASLLFGLYFGAIGGASTFFNAEPEVTLASIPLSGDILELGVEYNLDVVEENSN